MHQGFIKVAAAVPCVKVADINYNTQQIENLMILADAKHVEVITFPELCVTAYTCQDLFHQQLLLDSIETAMMRLLEISRGLSLTTIIGIPVTYNNTLLNCAAVIQNGHIHGLVPKTYIPGYNEFYEQRWFASSDIVPADTKIHFCGQHIPLGTDLIFDLGNTSFGIEICEDLWAPIPPSNRLALGGADIIFNLSASNDIIGKGRYVKELVIGQSARCIAGYVYASCGFGESTQDLVFGGKAYICENGHLLVKARRYGIKEQLVVSEIDVESIRHDRKQNTTFWQSMRLEQRKFRHIELDALQFDGNCFELTRQISPTPFVPKGSELNDRCEEIICMQGMGLATRIAHTHAECAVIGISGGLDSTLALLVAVHAFDRLGLDRKNIVGITMPGYGTTDRTYTNAINLMKGLGVTIREINISEAVDIHFRDLGHDKSNHDVVYENSQARERTQILMDAANQMNGIVVGTGDLSELALGWATYNGDHMSMYAVNVSIPKTLVRHLVSWVAKNMSDPYTRDTLIDIVNTPISPELIPADADGNIKQKTEDLVGPYELHDFFLYHTLRHGSRPSRIFYLARQAFDGRDGRTLYDVDTIRKWLTTFCRRFFNQQFKRSCLPDGPKVGSCSLSPRGDWRMPSDAVSAAWLKECEML